MNKNEHMIVCNNTFWKKLKDIIKNIFYKNKLVDNTEKNQNVIQQKSKDEVLEIYNEIKLGQKQLDELDEDTMYKVMMLLKEELNITKMKVRSELEQIEIQLYNLKMYNKEIELLKNNS